MKKSRNNLLFFIKVVFNVDQPCLSSDSSRVLRHNQGHIQNVLLEIHVVECEFIIGKKFMKNILRNLEVEFFDFDILRELLLVIFKVSTTDTRFLALITVARNVLVFLFF